MSQKILFNVRPHQTRIALVKNERLKDIIYHEEANSSLVGAIYKGQVGRLVEKLSFAFVNVGLKKSGFLYSKEHAGDIKVLKNQLKVRNFLMVQVKSDSYRNKGCRLTTDISLPGRHLVYKPLQKHKVACSRMISSADERERLKKILEAWKEPCGIIARTFAQNCSEEQLKKDFERLQERWKNIQEKYKSLEQVGVVEPALDPKLSYLTNLLDEKTEDVLIDDKKTYKQVYQFIKKLSPEYKSKIKFFSKEVNLFEEFDLEQKIEKSMNKKVYMKNGTFIVIEELEAFSIIDVNSGRFMGKGNLEEALLDINLQAAKAAAEQIRLRHLGGIILIDFIDMEEEKNQKKLLDYLRQLLAEDKSKPQVYPMSELGIIQITRKRTRNSLSHFTSQKCSQCQGTGLIKSHSYIAHNILIALEKKRLKKVGFLSKKASFEVICHPEIKNWLLKEAGKSLDFLKKELKILVQFKEKKQAGLDVFQIKKIED